MSIFFTLNLYEPPFEWTDDFGKVVNMPEYCGAYRVTTIFHCVSIPSLRTYET